MISIEDINELLESINVYGLSYTASIIYNEEEAIIYDYVLDQEEDIELEEGQQYKELNLWFILLLYCHAERQQALKRDLSFKCVYFYAVRLYSGLSQSRFAETFNLSLRTLQSWENGLREPKYDVIIPIMKQLGFTPEEIVDPIVNFDYLN